jgi:hypothetical protein
VAVVVGHNDVVVRELPVRVITEETVPPALMLASLHRGVEVPGGVVKVDFV